MRRSSLLNSYPVNYRVSNWLKTLWPYLMEYKGRVIAAFLCLIAAKLISVGIPFLLKYQVDHLSQAQNVMEDWWYWFPLGLLLAYGTARFLTTFIGELRDLLFGRVTERAMRRDRK